MGTGPKYKSSGGAVTPAGKNVRMKKAPKIGTGARFAALKQRLAGRKGVTSPAGLAAYIGRKKFGAAKMAKLSAKGRAV